MMEIVRSWTESLRDGDVRIAQSVSLVRHLPMILTCNAVSVISSVLTLGLDSSPLLALSIVAGMWIALMPLARSWWRLRDRPIPPAVSRGRINKIISYSGFLGVLWSAYILTCSSWTSPTATMFMVAGIMILFVGAIASMFFIPLACAAFATPIAITATVLTVQSETPEARPFLLTIVITVSTAVYCLNANWRNFRQVVQLSAEKDTLLQQLSDDVATRDDLLTAKQEAESALRAANAMLHRLANTDPLTELPNRRTFNVALDREWAHAAANGLTLSLLMLDADHFKLLNDRQGHQVGDECLRLIADCLRPASLEDADGVPERGRAVAPARLEPQGFPLPAGALAARLGGEEFAMVLPGVSAGDAMDIAEGLRGRIGVAGERFGLTISVGVATAGPDGRTGSARILLARSDAALYEAKRCGRNMSRLAA